jgi:hypothetical protein
MRLWSKRGALLSRGAKTDGRVAITLIGNSGREKIGDEQRIKQHVLITD